MAGSPRTPVTGVKNDPITLAVKRVFPMPFEGQQLEFRMEAFNALNHPQFGPPGTVQGSGTFWGGCSTPYGQSGSAVGFEILLLEYLGKTVELSLDFSQAGLRPSRHSLRIEI